MWLFSKDMKLLLVGNDAKSINILFNDCDSRKFGKVDIAINIYFKRYTYDM